MMVAVEHPQVAAMAHPAALLGFLPRPPIFHLVAVTVVEAAAAAVTAAVTAVVLSRMKTLTLTKTPIIVIDTTLTSVP
jgi:hypothetical protein